MTDGYFRGRVHPGGVPFDLPLPPPSGIRVAERLTEGNLGRLAAALARSYRAQWQSHLVGSAWRQRGGAALDHAVAQKLGDCVEAIMREPFRQQLEQQLAAGLLKKFDERLRSLEQAGSSTEAAQ